MVYIINSVRLYNGILYCILAYLASFVTLWVMGVKQFLGGPAGCDGTVRAGGGG